MNRGVEVPAALMLSGLSYPGLPSLSRLFLTTYGVSALPVSAARTPFTCLLDAAEAVWVLDALSLF